MNIWIYWISTILGSLFILVSMFYSMKQMGEDRECSRRKKCLVVGLYAVAVVAVSLSGKGILNLLMLLLVPILGNRYFHSGKKYFAYYVFLVISIFLTDSVVTVLLQGLVLFGVLYLTTPELMTLLSVFVLRFLEFLVLRLIVNLIRRNAGYDIRWKQLGMSLLLPVFSILNLYTMLFFMQIYLDETMLLLFILNLVCLLALNLGFVVFLDHISERERLKREVELYQQQSKLSCEYYAREEQKYEETRKIIHDIRNHIVTMEQLYRESGAEDAARYAGEVHGMLNCLGQTYYTADKTLNIILNDKVRLMQQQGISSNIKIGEVELSFLREMDITAVFANLLDNAIEAAAECEQPFVRLRVNQRGNLCSIAMENSCREEPRRDREGFCSRKAGHRGLGLLNVKRVAEQYEGDLQCEWKAGVFYTKVLMAERREESG